MEVKYNDFLHTTSHYTQLFLNAIIFFSIDIKISNLLISITIFLDLIENFILRFLFLLIVLKIFYF
jgi:hypothetical protein